MSDNGSAYRSKLHAFACRALGAAPPRAPPLPAADQRQGERFIRTMLGEWAYGAIYAHELRTHRRP